jgi:hypothetical protein
MDGQTLCRHYIHTVKTCKKELRDDLKDKKLYFPEMFYLLCLARSGTLVAMNYLER